jgi:hypothetical protein
METKMTVGRLGAQAAERRLNIARERGSPQSKNERETCCAVFLQLRAGWLSPENVADMTQRRKIWRRIA